MDQKRLLRLEEQCIQNQPPACIAACPVHVDARALARGGVAVGDFDRGRGGSSRRRCRSRA